MSFLSQGTENLSLKDDLDRARQEIGRLQAKGRDDARRLSELRPQEGAAKAAEDNARLVAQLRQENGRLRASRNSHRSAFQSLERSNEEVKTSLEEGARAANLYAPSNDSDDEE